VFEEDQKGRIVESEIVSSSLSLSLSLSYGKVRFLG